MTEESRRVLLSTTTEVGLVETRTESIGNEREDSTEKQKKSSSSREWNYTFIGDYDSVDNYKVRKFT